MKTLVPSNESNVRLDAEGGRKKRRKRKTRGRWEKKGSLLCAAGNTCTERVQGDGASAADSSVISSSPPTRRASPCFEAGRERSSNRGLSQQQQQQDWNRSEDQLLQLTLRWWGAWRPAEIAPSATTSFRPLFPSFLLFSRIARLISLFGGFTGSRKRDRGEGNKSGNNSTPRSRKERGRGR